MPEYQELNAEFSCELNHEMVSQCIKQLSLSCVELGDYIMIINSKFDSFIDDEPYLALMVIMNTQSGICKVKLWNRTLFAGRINSLDKLVQVCKENFGQGKPCSGFQLQAGDQTKYEGLLSLLPSPRKFAKGCHKFLKKDAGDSDDLFFVG